MFLTSRGNSDTCRPIVDRGLFFDVYRHDYRTAMATIKTYLRKYKMNVDSGIIWIQFYTNREKVSMTTGVICKDKDWDELYQRVKPGDKEFRDKNLVIDKLCARINDVLVKYRLRNKVLTKDAFIRAFNRPDDYDTFFEFVRDYQKKITVRMEMSTFNVHKSVIEKIKTYNPDLHFDDITTDWLDEFYSYLRKKLKNNENTAYKNMSTLRKYVRAAWKAGYMDDNPFENWSIKRTKASYSYLNEKELTAFIGLYNSGELSVEYYKTLEFFLFQCFSSLHVGDAKPLKLEQFGDNSFTYFRLKNRNSKPEPILVPISKPLRNILRNIVGTRKKGLIFNNLPADQTMNRYLKELAKKAGVDKQISHKVGRHTFATIYLKRTKDLASLKDILGHSELRETLIYAHVLDESKQQGVKVFNNFKI